MGLVRKSDMKKAVKPGLVQEEQPERVSRTQKKKAALSLQDLGERLVKLSDAQLKRIGLPGAVLAAVQAAKTIKKHTPLNRQLQYIGALMRKHDPAPIKEFLDAREPGKRIKIAKPGSGHQVQPAVPEKDPLGEDEGRRNVSQVRQERLEKTGK